MKRKFFGLLIYFGLVVPGIVLAQEVNWGLRVSGGNFGVQMGSGGGFNAASSFGLPDSSIMGIITNILFWLLTVIGFVSIIGFAIAGILYLTAAGDDNQISRAKTAMKNSIIGVIVGLSGFVVLRAASYMLSGVFF